MVISEVISYQLSYLFIINDQLRDKTPCQFVTWLDKLLSNYNMIKSAEEARANRKVGKSVNLRQEKHKLTIE